MSVNMYASVLHKVKYENAVFCVQREVQRNHASISTLEAQLQDAEDAKQSCEAQIEAESSKALKAEVCTAHISVVLLHSASSYGILQYGIWESYLNWYLNF